ncbi:MAG: hypothetical protein Q9204_007274 [Flavoplaca sp. TL-2023a]
MYFHRAAAFALTASLALVDARAITKTASQPNGGIAERGNNAISDDLIPRWTNKVTGEKLSVRALSGLGDDIQVSKRAFEANAKACSVSLEKLRKLRRKRAARAERKVRRKRASSDDDDEEMEDDEEGQEEGEDEGTDTGGDMEVDSDEPESDEPEDEDLGTGSYTVRMGEGEFFPYDNKKGASVIGTIALNSCSGVLIVGEKGAIIAHLKPISPQEGLTEAMFQKSVDVNVTGLYTKHAADLGVAKIYMAVPNIDNGEKVILETAADGLKIEQDTTGYDRAANSIWETENYFETGRGTMYVNFRDRNNLKVKVFGIDKKAPSKPASSEGEQQGPEEGGDVMEQEGSEGGPEEGDVMEQEGSEESLEEGEIREEEGSEEGEIVEDQMQQ